MSSFDAGNHYPENILRIEKFRPGHVWTAILNDADQGFPYLKRFTFEPTTKLQRYLGENTDSTLILLSDELGARFEIKFGGADSFREPLIVDAIDFIAVKSFKAKGKRLTTFPIDSITELEPRETADINDEEASDEPADETEADATDAEQEPERSDDEVRDEINGQERLF